MSNGDVVPSVRRVHAVLVGFVTVIVFLLLYIGDLRASFRVSTQPRIVELLCPPKSYMFPLRIVEQLTMSTAHFHQFLNLVNDWNFTGVEPFAYGSTMYGLRSLHPDNPAGSVPFNKLFNVTIHNEYLSKCMKRQPDPETGSPILFEPMTEFLRRSYRRLILVFFAAHRDVLGHNIQGKVENEINEEKGPFTDCTSAAQTHGMFKHVEDLLAKELELERYHPSDGQSKPLPKYLENLKFKGVQAFCIKRDIKISLRDLREYVLSHMHREVGSSHKASIIFISWQGRFTHPLADSDVKSYINNCRLPFSQPFHNDHVVNTANRFIDSLGFSGQPYLSVHVRFEKLYYFVLAKGKPLDAYLDCCMKRLNSLLSVVAEKFNISMGSILLNWDYSPHGSMECPIHQCRHVANKHLKKVNARPVFFKPEDFGIPAQPSIISLVEMDALLGGKAVVTVGGGSYQYTLWNTFIEQHRDLDNPDAAANDELHYGHLCVPDENLHGLTLQPEC